MTPRIKICCIASVDEARRAASDRDLPPHEPRFGGRDRRAATALPREHDPDLRPAGAGRLRGASRSAAGDRASTSDSCRRERVVRNGGPRRPRGRRLAARFGEPSAAIKTLGGTGRTHDWAISARIVEASSKPVFLAGGLTPENVREAIRAVRPFGLDFCNGVRTDGVLDDDKLRRFMAAVRA